MKKLFEKISISAKISIIAAVGTVVAISILILVSTTVLKEKLIEKGKIEATSIAKTYVSEVASKVDLAFLASENLSFSISELELPLNTGKLQHILTEMLLRNREFRGASFIAKNKIIDTSLVSEFFFTNNKKQTVLHLCNNEDEITYKLKDNLSLTKTSKLEIIKLKENDELIIILTTNIPIYKEGIHIANVSLHFELNSEKKENLKAYFDNTIVLSLLSDNGTYLSNNKYPNLIGSNLMKNTSEQYAANEEQLLDINKGSTLIFDYKKNSYFFFPVEFIKYDKKWQVRVAIPTSVIVKEATDGMLKKAILGIVLSIVILLIVLFFIRRNLKPLYKLVHITEQISHGELYHKLETRNKDEVGLILLSFDEMIHEIAKIVTSINGSSIKLNKSSLKAKDEANKVSESVSEQAASVEEISSSTEQILASIIQNTETSKQTEAQAINLVKAIETVNVSFEETVQSMHQIVEKIAIINEIAARTDLLAINAAIEAARAGEVGKGFAVVAHEIRKLAENSIESAKVIDQLSSVSVEKSKESVGLLLDVVEKVKENANSMNEIRSTSQEQNLGVQQVNESINQLNITTQQNSILAETFSLNAQVFNDMAKDMEETISFFQLKRKK